MAYLLRLLIATVFAGVVLVICSAHSYISLPYGHIEMAIPLMMFLIFVQAFTMFYFIGVARLVENIHHTLSGSKKEDLKELFEEPPSDLSPYLKKVNRFVYQSKVSKRQTIPWSILVLTLGSIGFLLGGAHHTGMVQKIIHSGVIYGFFTALIISLVRQWIHLGKAHILLRELKNLFQIPDSSM